MINYLHEISNELDLMKVYPSINCEISIEQKWLRSSAQLIISCHNDILDLLMEAARRTNDAETLSYINFHIHGEIDRCHLNDVHTIIVDKLHNIGIKYGLKFDISVVKTNYHSLIIYCDVNKEKIT